MKLYGLDLFSGTGGLTVALGRWVRPVAYCEIDLHCQGMLLSRMQCGELPIAPIWDDVRTLRGDMLPFTPDIIYGGFPCQDISSAGTGKGLAGKRSGLFFEIARLMEECEPRFIFLENSPTIRTRGAERIGQTLAGLGYDCRWTNLRASDVGANHRRKRWFCLARRRANVDYSDGIGREGNNGRERREVIENRCQIVSDVTRERIWRLPEGSGQEGKGTKDLSRGGWWTAEPKLVRVANGIPNRVDRIRALGNAVVPVQAERAFERLLTLT